MVFSAQRISIYVFDRFIGELIVHHISNASARRRLALVDDCKESDIIAMIERFYLAPYKVGILRSEVRSKRERCLVVPTPDGREVKN